MNHKLLFKMNIFMAIADSISAFVWAGRDNRTAVMCMLGSVSCLIGASVAHYLDKRESKNDIA